MKIGVIRARFQSVGKQPVPIERLNNFVRLGVMDEMVDLSIIADTSSRPVDFAGFREFSTSATCSSVHWIDAGHSVGFKAVGVLRGGKE